MSWNKRVKPLPRGRRPQVSLEYFVGLSPCFQQECMCRPSGHQQCVASGTVPAGIWTLSTFGTDSKHFDMFEHEFQAQRMLNKGKMFKHHLLWYWQSIKFIHLRCVPSRSKRSRFVSLGSGRLPKLITVVVDLNSARKCARLRQAGVQPACDKLSSLSTL